MKKDTKTLVLTWVAVLTLIACVIGATYAYFTAQMGSGSSANVSANTGTTDSLKFTVGSALSITANQENFAEGKGNRSASTTATAEVIANNTTNSAIYNYYLYLDIAKNEFVYTTDENTAELILQITKPDGTELTTLNGLNYVTVGSVSGFDITTKNGLITLADNYEIKAEAAAPTATKSDEWTATLVLVNLDSNQKENTNKQFVASLKIQQNKIADSLADVCSANENMASCVKKLYSGSIPTISNLYLHDASLASGANDGSYRYSGADPKNYVCFGSNEATCPADNLYRIIGVFGDQVKLIKYDYASSTLLGTDGDYAGTAADWDLDDATLTSWGYKGIYNTSTLATYYWNGPTHKGGTENNNWNESRLNTVNLNTNYLNNIGTEWSNKIAETTWRVGGIDAQNGAFSNAKTAYDYELGASKTDTTYNAKVGLMYISEYGYAASPENWTTSLYDYDNETNRNNNWMYMGAYEWTITRVSGYSDPAFRVDGDGYVDSSVVHTGYGVRPSFGLTSDVRLGGGDGTKTSPYRIVL